MPVDLSFFKNDPNYRGFRDEDWKILSSLMEEATFKDKTKIFKENDPGDGFYWIYYGKVKITRLFQPEGQKTPQENVITVLSPGTLFGEMALIDKAPRSADATADGSVVLYHMSHAHYQKLCKEHPSTGMAIQDLLVKTLCSRLREANRSFETIYFWCS